MEAQTKAAAVKAAKCELARRELSYFASHMLGVTPAKHHLLLCHKLTQVAEGKIKRLMVFMPPGHAKSTYSSHLFPAWYLGHNPKHTVITASYNAELAHRFGRKVRNLFGAEEWPFEGITLAGDQQAKNQWETSEGGEYYAAGVGGGVTGRRADLAIIDDPVKGHEEADSPTYRNRVWEWYLSDLLTRMKPNGAIIIIMTRWHEDDLAGRLLQLEKDMWDVISLPALAEPNDPLCRDVGEALWPEWMPTEKLEAVKAAQTPRNWLSLYQQRPTAEEGDFFKLEWVKYYDEPPKHLHYYGASDYAVTESGGDYTVHILIGVDAQENIYVIDLWRRQTLPNVWIEALFDLVKRYQPLAWGEETGQIVKSVGPFINKKMQEDKTFFLRLPYSSAVDKPTRARSIQARIAVKGLYLPRRASWVPEFISELLSFPTGKNDDQVDAISLIGRMLANLTAGQIPKSEQRSGGLTLNDLWSQTNHKAPYYKREYS